MKIEQVVFKVEPAEPNSKGITHTVVTDGMIVGCVQERDLERFLGELERCNYRSDEVLPADKLEEHIKYKAGSYTEGVSTVSYSYHFAIPYEITLRGEKRRYLKRASLIVYPDGMDATGHGTNYFILEETVCLTNWYERPRGVRIIQPGQVLRTGRGNFKIDVNRAFISATKESV